jgi:uncharacterized protein (UPF0548 family)
MLLLHRPPADKIQEFLKAQASRPFSYPEVGMSRWTPPPGYFVDHHRARLGEGRETFERACDAIRAWRMFDIGWVDLYSPEAPIDPGSTVAVVAGRLGLWSLNACRIVYVIDEPGPVERFGFAYGTLPDHIERGEERFSVEWRHEDDSVWYDLFCFSWPNHFVAQCGFPYIRRMQKRFRHDSSAAMLRAQSTSRLPAAAVPRTTVSSSTATTAVT